MKVKELIDKLSTMNPNAEVMGLTIQKGIILPVHLPIIEVAEELPDLVTVRCEDNVYTIDMLEKAIDTQDMNVLKVFKSRDIGQGYGYKLYKDWDKIEDDEVIYIPEYAYKQIEPEEKWFDVPFSINGCYTKEDFIDIVGDEERAQTLFEDVDWQYPETLADEYDWQTDYWKANSEKNK